MKINTKSIDNTKNMLYLYFVNMTQQKISKMKTYRLENENINDRKAYNFLEKMISNNLEIGDRIIIDKNGDVHSCDLALAKISDIEKRKDIAMYAILRNDDKVALHKLF